MTAAISVLMEAFAKSDLPKENKHGPDFVCPLGMDEYDRFVYDLLLNAGITVELLSDQPIDKSAEDLYSAVQIVDDWDMNHFFKQKDPDEISLCDKDDMLGVQVKLHAGLRWKLTISNDMKEQHPIEPRRSSRTPAGRVSTFENLHLYEIAVNVSNDLLNTGMRCTVAMARHITINIAFKKSEEGYPKDDDVIWNEDNNLPLVLQRRIDAVFTSKYVTSVQVRARCRTEHATEHATEHTTEHATEPLRTYTHSHVPPLVAECVVRRCGGRSLRRSQEQQFGSSLGCVRDAQQVGRHGSMCVA